MKAYLVTGGAGFIGSHLVDRLLTDQETGEVRVIDDFSSGRIDHLKQNVHNDKLKVFSADLVDLNAVMRYFDGVDRVYHLAANPDARKGIENTKLDLELETIATYNVLECMRRCWVKEIMFSSSGTVYGDTKQISDERMGPCLPISLYGAGKLAAEGLISAFCGTFKLSGIILRFGNVVGERATHGCIFDFIQKLQKDPRVLEVLGNGNQSKPYIYVQEIVDALVFSGGLFVDGRCDVFNVAPPSESTVSFIAKELLRQLNLFDKVPIICGTTTGGWAGDVPESRMNSDRIAMKGFRLGRNSNEAVVLAIQKILESQ